MATRSDLVRQFLLEEDWDRRRQLVREHPELLHDDAGRRSGRRPART